MANTTIATTRGVADSSEERIRITAEDVEVGSPPGPVECECGAVVNPGDIYYSTPCGTHCEGCMEKHMADCECCRKEFR